MVDSENPQAPVWFSTAPVPATKFCGQTGWRASDVDLVEVNEAFAVVAMAEHGIARDRMNVRGGACALGHPIGASGARHRVALRRRRRSDRGRDRAAVKNGIRRAPMRPAVP